MRMARSATRSSVNRTGRCSAPVLMLGRALSSSTHCRVALSRSAVLLSRQQAMRGAARAARAAAAHGRGIQVVSLSSTRRWRTFRSASWISAVPSIGRLQQEFSARLARSLGRSCLRGRTPSWSPMPPASGRGTRGGGTRWGPRNHDAQASGPLDVEPLERGEAEGKGCRVSRNVTKANSPTNVKFTRARDA